MVVDVSRLKTLGTLGNHNRCAALVQFMNEPVAVVGLVGDEGVEGHAVDQRRHTDGVVAVAGREFEPDKVGQCIGEATILVVQPPFDLPMAWPHVRPLAP